MFKISGVCFVGVLYFFTIFLPVKAQDDSSPYDVAVQRIEAAVAIESRRLDLSRLGLTEVPPLIGELTSVKTLRLDENNLTTIPSDIFLLESLEVLTISHNQLTEIPPDISRLHNLDYLDLSFNQLESLPSTIGELTRLSHLDLQSNHLMTIPATMGNLQDLCYLSINDNYLEHLPLSIGQLERLGRTDMHCNGGDTVIRVDLNPPLVNPPAAVIQAGSFAIIAHLHHQNELQQNTVQWLLIGFVSGLGFAILLRLVFNLKRLSPRKPKS